MRIGYDAKRAFFNQRGLGHYSRNIISGFLNFYPENKYFLYTPALRDQEQKAWLGNQDNCNIVESRGIFKKALSPLWRSFYIKKDIEHDQIDLYHGLSHEIPVGVEELKIKKIVTIHDLIFLRYPQFFPFIDRQVYFKKFTHACKTADRVVAICEQTKRDIIEFFNTPEEKISVSYQTCLKDFYEKSFSDEEITEFKKKYSIERPFILFNAAIEERKNPMNLLKAFQGLAKETDHELILVGNGSSYKNKIIDFINSSDELKKRARLISEIQDSELPMFYKTCDLFVYPSFFEGFGIPIIQALFSSVPVITSEGSCFPEAGGDSAIYINPYHEDEIGDAILKVLRDESLRSDMIQKGNSFVQKFKTEETTRDLMGIYRSVIKDKLVN